MNYLSAETLTKSFGEHVLFENISLGLSRGQRVALIARNGAGKSTLLNILAGKDVPDNGSVSLRKEISIAYLDQNPVFEPGRTVLQTILAAENPLQQAVANYEHLLDHEDSANPQYNKALEAAMNQMAELDAWDYEADVRQVLERLRLTRLDQPVAQLSGGQLKRLALARVLLQRAELFILDEPTNHLDLDMVEWLEKFLSRQGTTLLLVTHDRYFLENICSEILELADRTLYKYEGTYADFLEKKATREADQQQSTDRARNLLRKELEWMRRQPKARGTKSRARIDSFYELKDKAAARPEGPALTLEVQMARMGSQVLELAHVNKSYGGQLLLDDFSYTFRRGERAGIVGRNGVGKSTFLNLITGGAQPDSGTLKTGETIVFGYYTQSGLSFKPEDRVIDVVKAIAEVISVGPKGKEELIPVEQFLQRFQFAPARQYTPVAKLSGGEKRRLHLLTVLVRQPNFLILDEPTNDLDLPTLESLEDFLESFGGCILIVTHDRAFMDRLVDHLFIFEGNGQVKDFNGNYTDYRLAREAQEAEIRHQVMDPGTDFKPANQAPKQKLSFKEQKEYETLTKEIEELELEKNRLDAQMSGGGTTDHLQLQIWGEEIRQLMKDLDTKTTRWIELADLVE